MSGWTRTKLASLVILGALVLVACGGERLDVNEPNQSFTVAIPTKSFPGTQSLSEHTHLVLAVRNDSHATIPNVTVTLCNVACEPGPGQSYQQLAQAGEGSYARPFATGPTIEQASSEAGQPEPASNYDATRQIWIVDKPPDPANCKGRAGYSCAAGNVGGAVTYEANTWTLGPLKAGQVKTFDWAVTAVKPGHHVVAWEVSAGLSGKAKAVLSNGATPAGTFPVTISRTPGQSYVDNNGNIVSSPNGR